MMSAIGEDLLVYLKAYNPEDHGKLTQSDNVPEALINAIYAKHKERFEAWRKIPTEFRDSSNRVPEEVMQKAINGETINHNTVESTRPTTAEVVSAAADVGIALSESDMVLVSEAALKITLIGYGEKAAKEIATDKIIRKKLSEIIHSGQPLSKEQQKVWRLTRENDHRVIEADWKENQPERYALHLIKKMNAGKIDKDKALPEIEKYIAKTFALNRRQNLFDTLQNTPRLKKMSPETKQILKHILAKNNMDTKSLPEKIKVLRGLDPQEATHVQKTTLSKNLNKNIMKTYG